MQTFKVGDSVKCVDPAHGLILSATYTIKYVCGKHVSVVSGKEASLYSSRFVKLTAKFKGNIK